MSHLDNFIFLFYHAGTPGRSFGAFFSERALGVVGIVIRIRKTFDAAMYESAGLLKITWAVE